MSSPHPATLFKTKTLNTNGVALQRINETWIARGICLRGFRGRAEEKKTFSFTQIQKFAMLQSIWSAEKKEEKVIACLILSLTSRLREMAAAGVAVASRIHRHRRRVAEKHILSLYTFTNFFSLLFCSLHARYYFSGFRGVCISFCLFTPRTLRLFVFERRFLVRIGIGTAVAAAWLCHVVSTSPFVDHIIFARWIHFNVTLHIHYFDKDQTRGSVFRFLQFVCANMPLLHPILHNALLFPFFVRFTYYIFRYIFLSPIFFVSSRLPLPKSFAPICDKHRYSIYGAEKKIAVRRGFLFDWIFIEIERRRRKNSST